MQITDKITITNEDNMSLMARYPDKYFDLAIVDPPYGINIVDEFKKTVKSKSSMFNMSKGIKGDGEWDKCIPDESYFDELKRVSKNQIIWGGNYFIEYLNSSRCFLIWDKMNGTNPMADAEMAWTSFDKSIRMFKMHHFSAGYETKIHPTQKPTKLYEWILKNYAKLNDKILDTHLGSGSIAIACHRSKHELTACELDKEYYDSAIERILKETDQGLLF